MLTTVVQLIAIVGDYNWAINQNAALGVAWTGLAVRVSKACASHITDRWKSEKPNAVVKRRGHAPTDGPKLQYGLRADFSQYGSSLPKEMDWWMDALFVTCFHSDYSDCPGRTLSCISRVLTAIVQLVLSICPGTTVTIHCTAYSPWNSQPAKHQSANYKNK